MMVKSFQQVNEMDILEVNIEAFNDWLRSLDAFLLLKYRMQVSVNE